MDRLDQFVQNTLIPEYTKGDQRKDHQRYHALKTLGQYHRRRGNLERAEALRREAQQLPSIDPNDQEYKRLRYTRYADDCLLGLIGTKAEAEESKNRLATFLETKLKLTLATDKTLITHAHTERARFLGYDIGIMHSQTKFDRRRQRVINGKIGLYIPEDVIQKKRKRYLRDEKPSARIELINNSEYDIIYRYQGEYRGLVEYYGMAHNIAQLGYVRWIMESSLLKTLAAKGDTTVEKIVKRLKTTIKTPEGPRKCLRLTIPREGKKPLICTFGGIPLKRRMKAAIKDQVILPYANKRTEIIERLLKDTCEICGSKERIEMHHIRKLADLNKKREKPLWMKIMIARKRKSIPLCKRCHVDIHSGQKSKKQGNRRAG